MFEFVGNIERLVADLYPYRVPISIGMLLVAVALFVVAWRMGWVAAIARTVRRYPVQSVAAVVVVLAVTLPVGWYLASPLWTRIELIEESPLAAVASQETPTASVPQGTPVTEGTPTTNGTPTGQPPVMMTEPVPTEPVPTEIPFVPAEVSRGIWMGADSFHFAEGEALIIETAPGEYVLRVENFSVRNGPDLYMMLSPDPDGYAEGALNLGELRATDGAFNYDIPPGTDLADYASVIVWCEDFAVLFATATLEEL